MAYKRVLDAKGSMKYERTEGEGTLADPFVPVTGADFTLAASAARTDTAGTNGTAVTINGKWVFMNILCEFTAKGTDATDTCDVYVDVLIGSTWINAIHFTQALGNGTDAAKEYATLGASSSNTIVTTATADLASGAVRADCFGSQIRARWVIVDTGTDDASFTFSVIGYGI